MTRPRISRAFPAAALAAAVLFPRPSASGEENAAETAFRAAREYTVRVHTRIDTPFLGDTEGAYEGAGFLVDAQRGWIVTNAHVVGRSVNDVQVAFYRQSFEPAKALYVDSFADIAILTLELVKTQREVEAKFRDILTDDQKKQYDELKRPERPRRRPQR